jgi:hypothetical protein
LHHVRTVPTLQGRAELNSGLVGSEKGCPRPWTPLAGCGQYVLSAVGARGRKPHGEARTFRYPRRIGPLPDVVKGRTVTNNGSAVNVAVPAGHYPERVADAVVPIEGCGSFPRAPLVRPNRLYEARISIGGTCAQGQSDHRDTCREQRSSGGGLHVVAHDVPSSLEAPWCHNHAADALANSWNPPTSRESAVATPGEGGDFGTLFPIRHPVAHVLFRRAARVWEPVRSNPTSYLEVGHLPQLVRPRHHSPVAG